MDTLNYASKPKIGAVFPQTEIGENPEDIKEYVLAVESMGFDHILIYDHVLGADIERRPNWTGAYDLDHPFHEILVLFGFIAALTSTIELTTGILVLPQRDTGLVAKQAAELDILSNGRLRLGVGIGWNAVEFEALNSNFYDRGARIEEQISVLRELWTNELVSYEGKWHQLNDVGLNPLPTQRPIPVWFGGEADQVMNRIGEMGDGWIYPNSAPFPEKKSKEMLDLIKNSAKRFNRSADAIGIEKIFSVSEKPKDGWKYPVQSWLEFGATHLSLNTMDANLPSIKDHLKALEFFINEIIQ